MSDRPPTFNDAYADPDSPHPWTPQQQYVHSQIPPPHGFYPYQPYPNQSYPNQPYQNQPYQELNPFHQQLGGQYSNMPPPRQSYFTGYLDSSSLVAVISDNSVMHGSGSQKRSSTQSLETDADVQSPTKKKSMKGVVNRTWSKQHDETLIPFLTNEVKKGCKPDKQFKMSTFNQAAEYVNNQWGTCYTGENVKNHVKPDKQFPDPLVLLILNKVADIRALGRCSSVSKRFNALIPLVHDVNIKIDRVVSVNGDPDTDPSNPSIPKPRNLLSHLLKMMVFSFIKPFNHLRNTNGGNVSRSHHSPAQVLKNFTHVRNLRIELPAGDVSTEEGVLLKWRAEFGCTLHNCVILGGTRVDRKPEASLEDNGSIPESFYENGGLMLRVVWTISSLIAATTRHYLLRSIIKDHPSLRSLVLTDADGQGTIVMGAEQLKEFRENPLAASASSNRTQVPPSNMKLRHAPYLELGDGMGMQGATLVSIKPSSSDGRREGEAFVSGEFDGPFRMAAKTLRKRRTYLLEMNGF